MNSRLFASCLLALLPATAAAQPGQPVERLSLDAAIKTALDQNRGLASARLDVERAEAELAMARTRRLPSLETTAMASHLLTPVSFSFPQGAFGTFPGIGPVPATSTDVQTPRGANYYLSSQVSQPLSQLFRIGLSVRGAAASRAAAVERTREQQLATVNAVKRLYFAILQTESAITANGEALALYRELDRTVANRVAQKVSLQSEGLDVRLKLAEAELSRTTLDNTLASQKEQLNQLLGRDVATMFQVEAASAAATYAVELDAVRARALADRPDVREARLKVEQAELDRRAASAGRIPDVSLAVSYTSNFNIDALPRNLAAVGVQFKWEPFDWGRRSREVAAKSQIVSQAKLAVREIEDRATLEINSRFRKLAEAKAYLEVVDMARGVAREKLRVATNRYQVQAALLTDVLELRSRLADSDSRYQDALMAFWTARADFEQAIGEGVVQ